MTYYGEYGGRVLRAFKGEVPWVVGADIPAEIALSWPLANRKALYNTHKVEWYGPPANERKQRPAPVRKAAEPPADKAVDNPPAVIPSSGPPRNSRRRK